MNEYKNIDTPNKNHSVRWCTQDKNMGSITTKTNNGRNFNMQNSQWLNWSLPTEEIFQVHGEYQPVANLLEVDFRSQPREMPLPKPLNT